VTLALQRSLDIMRIDASTLTGDVKSLAKVMTEQRAIAAIVLSAQVRIDEAKLRRVDVDKLAELLEEVRAEEAAELAASLF